MGLLKYLFSFNLTAMDEHTIARGVQIGMSLNERVQENARLLWHQKVEKHNEEIAPVINTAREYEKSFMLVNNIVNRHYGYKLMFNPMMKPRCMNAEQRKFTFDTIAKLVEDGEIPKEHAERMIKYLNDTLNQ